MPRDAAALAWLANLACLELHPHPVRAEDLEHPDELRVDLDPVPGVKWNQVRKTASWCAACWTTSTCAAGPKPRASADCTSTSAFTRAGRLTRRRRRALAREVERRAPQLATSKWWKEERHGVFVDYNQNAKDRTVAAAYSVRPTPNATVSAPLSWDEVADCDPADFTLATMPARFKKIGDRHAGIDNEPAPSRTSRACSTSRAWATRRGPRITGNKPRAAARQPSRKIPLLRIARARRQEDALAGLERWKKRHPEAAAHLSLPMCWSTPCAAATAPGRASG